MPELVLTNSCFCTLCCACICFVMITSSNGNVFRDTGPLCGEFTSHLWIPSTKFPPQRPLTRSFDVFFDLRLNKRLSKQSIRRWLETLSRPLWRHCNVLTTWRKLSDKHRTEYLGNRRYVYIFAISQHCYGTGCWNCVKNWEIFTDPTYMLLVIFTIISDVWGPAFQTTQHLLNTVLFSGSQSGFVLILTTVWNLFS